MNSKTIQITLGILFLLGISGAGFSNLIPREYAFFYLAISLVTFVAYGIDKAAAVREDRRIPELILHLFSLFGGWAGALIAQQLFCHKTIKVPFRVIFWITVIANCGILYKLLIIPEGTALFKLVV